MKVKCYNQKCLNVWNYRGQSKDYITCSKCHYRIKLDKAIVYYFNSKNEETLKSTHSLIAFTHSQKKESEVERVYGCLVHKDIAKQFKEAPEELEEDVEVIYEQEPPIKILSPTLPTSIQKAFYEKEEEQNNPFLNPPREEPNFEITVIPKDPIKILEHQIAYSKWR